MKFGLIIIRQFRSARTLISLNTELDGENSVWVRLGSFAAIFDIIMNFYGLLVSRDTSFFQRIFKFSSTDFPYKARISVRLQISELNSGC